MQGWHGQVQPFVFREQNLGHFSQTSCQRKQSNKFSLRKSVKYRYLCIYDIWNEIFRYFSTLFFKIFLNHHLI